MAALISDLHGSLELQSIRTNNNIPQLSITSSSAESPSIISKEESVIITTHHPRSDKDAASPVDNGNPVKMGTSNRTLGILFSFAIIFLVAGITLGIFWMIIYNHFLYKELILSPTSRSYGIWKEIPIPMYLNLYLYNWTNPEEFVTSSNVKPNFVEMGPYVFKEQHVKVNEIWNENGTITFQQRRIWHFQESMSNGSLDDEVTNINVIAATVGHFVRNEGWFIRRLISGFLISYNQTLAVTKTARELLFDGYDDPFLDFARKLNSSAFDIPFDKFGWFYGRNGSASYDGVFNMETGDKEISELGVLKNWKYENHTNYWSGDCGSVRGTTGELWPPVTDNQNVEIFAPDICTSLTLSRINDSTFSDIPGHTFKASEGTFDNGTQVPSRTCYCDEEEGTCAPSGVLGVTKCKFGAPAYVSLPHFHLADQYYTDSITGLDPSNEDDNFVMTIEPNTGIPLNVRAQMQINILVEPIRDIELFTGIPRNYIPVLWFRQEAKLTDDFARQIKFLLIFAKLGTPLCIAIGCAGIVLALVAFYLCFCRRSRAGENQLLIVKDDVGNGAKTDPVETT